MQQTVFNTYAQVARAQSCENHVQHIKRLSHAMSWHVPLGGKGQLSYWVWQSLNRIYCSFILLTEPLTSEGGEETGVPGENPWRWASENATYSNQKIQAPSETQTCTPALVAGWESRHANRYTTRHVSFWILWILAPENLCFQRLEQECFLVYFGIIMTVIVTTLCWTIMTVSLLLLCAEQSWLCHCYCFVQNNHDYVIVTTLCWTIMTVSLLLLCAEQSWLSLLLLCAEQSWQCHCYCFVQNNHDCHCYYFVLNNHDCVIVTALCRTLPSRRGWINLGPSECQVGLLLIPMLASPVLHTSAPSSTPSGRIPMAYLSVPSSSGGADPKVHLQLFKGFAHCSDWLLSKGK